VGIKASPNCRRLSPMASLILYLEYQPKAEGGELVADSLHMPKVSVCVMVWEPRGWTFGA
jgi:hypothetical protein